MSKRIILIVCCLWIGAVGVALGQTTRAKWTLEECLTHGLQNNISVRQGQLDVESSEISTKQSQLERLPSVNASSTLSTNLGRTINPFTNQFTEGNFVAQRVNANASVTLFNGFVIQNTINRNRLNEEASQYSLEDTKRQVSLNIIAFYTQVLFNREQLKAAEARLETSKSQLSRTAKQVELGVFPDANRLQAQQQVAADEVQVINFRNAVALSLLQLKQLIMVAPGEAFDVQSPTIELPDNYLVADGSNQVYEEAVATLPVIKAADARVESAEYDVKIAQGGRYPSLSAGIGWGSAFSSQPSAIPNGDPIEIFVPIGTVVTTGDQVVRRLETLDDPIENPNYVQQLDFNSSTGVSATLSVPIFNNYRTQAQIDQAKIALERAEVSAVNSRNVLRQTIEQAYQNVVAAQSTYRANRNQVEAQRELFSNVEQRYNLGAADVVEYTQSKNNLATAEADFIRAKYDYLFAIKILEFYQNKPLTFN